MAPVMVGAPLYSESQRYLTLAARAAATAGAAISGGYGLTGSQKWNFFMTTTSLNSSGA